MADQLRTTFSEIADAIRTKSGTTEPISARNFANSILNLQSGGAVEPIIKVVEQSENGMTITFTETELEQINNNLGTVVKADIDGGYLPLSPAYPCLVTETMQTKLILCCKIVEMDM